VSVEEKYVAAAYLVVFGFVLLYIVIMAAKVSKLARDVAELTARLRERRAAEQRSTKATVEPARDEVEVG
jgi:cell division protein FtsB